MNIDVEFYKVFCIVAENGSFSKAAEKLYISQPAITQTIRKLEEQLGGKLFYRNNNGVALTEEGKKLYAYIKDSIEIVSNASAKFKQYKDLDEGILRIKTRKKQCRNHII